MNRMYCTCESDGVHMSYGPRGELGKNDEERVVRTYDEFIAFLIDCRESVVLCSSSMDFPQDYTDDADVIALCNRIRQV